MISIFDMFKVGIGPSSSHTVGPMKAGKQFVDDLVEKGLLESVTRVAVDVYGSLSLTGKGHHTDIAIIMDLAGNMPDTVDIDAIPAFIRDVETRGRLLLANGQHEVDFPQDDGMRFRSDNLPLHENGMTIHAWSGEKEIYSTTYYSIGGGFIVDEEHFGKESAGDVNVPYPFKSATEMLGYCKETGLSLSGMVMQNELALHSKKEIEDYFANVWQTMRACIDRGMNTEGVDYAVAFPGLNALQFTNTPNTGTVFFGLKPFDQRKHTAAEINAEINAKIAQIQQGFGFSILPPPILGLGQGSGYSLYIQDRAGLGYGELQNAVNTMSGAIMQTPGMHFPISTYQANVPQLDVQVDRDKAKAQGVSLTDLFGTLQTYLGSSYVNDFNQFGRTWRVMAQADGQFRDSVEDIANLRTRNNQGEMVPIGSMVKITTTYGPDPVIRYNGYPAADLIGDADPRVLSSAQAMTQLDAMSKQILPNGMNIEWTDLSFQQATQGNTALIVFPVAVLLAFLVLAALYESWTLPLAVILIVPMTMISALFGVWLTGGDNNVFVQVGLVVLMGLACKNAILIVEFARELEIQGKGIMEAALEACRLRLRPIVMTSIAFIAGTIPLILGHGAGAEVRGVTGITVFAGMLGVTLFGLFLTPVFYVTLRKFVTRGKAEREVLPA